jgi:hypothetical protein
VISRPAESAQTALFGSLPKREDAKLAYEHAVSIELDQAGIAGRAQAIQAACAADEQFGCTVLELSVRTADQLPSALIRMRLAPG